MSHPELIVAYDAFPYFWWCAEPPCGALKLNNSAVDAFLEKLFADLLPRVSPYAAYFHTGGDELTRTTHSGQGRRSNDPTVLQPLVQAFIDANHGRIRKAGLAPMVWEEIPLTWNVTLGDDVVVQTWLGDASVKTLTSNGRKVIDSNYNFWVSLSIFSSDLGQNPWIRKGRLYHHPTHPPPPKKNHLDIKLTFLCFIVLGLRTWPVAQL